MFDCVCYALPLACDLANTHADIKNYNFDIPQAKTVKVDFNKKHFNGLVENTRKKISMEVFYLVTKHGAELAKLRTGDKVKSWLVKNYSDKKTKVKSYRTLASQTKKEKILALVIRRQQKRLLKVVSRTIRHYGNCYFFWFNYRQKKLPKQGT